jgi:uncharacterized protein (DUF305 family)
MKTTYSLATFVLSAAMALSPGNVLAQEGTDAGRTLPEICKTGVVHDTGSSAMGGEHQASDQAHQDLMAGMDAMNANMMQGSTAPDIDVAFVCSMIPHHQGAIDMAKAELEHGDDAWAKEMAQKVITAQEQEITDMLKWLEQQGQ